MSNHDHFKELYALAEAGQLSDSEMKELLAHMDSCDCCREGHTDLLEAVRTQVASLEDFHLPTTESRTRSTKGNGLRERFLQRARTNGVQFSEEVDRQGRPLLRRFSHFLVRPQVAAAAAIILVVATVWFLYWWREARTENSEFAAQNRMLSRQVSLLAERSEQLRGKLEASERLQESLKSELSRERGAHSAVAAETDSLRVELQDLRTALEDSNRENAQLSTKMQEGQRHLGELSDEVQRLRTARADDASTIATQHLRLNELTEQIGAQRELLERERQLLAADRDIRELMGARNLYIIDVFDADGRGRNRKAFGRVFYTEDKSLIFYAFDLGNGNVSRAEHSFQAWGRREGAPSSAISLGIFYLDDQAQKRWVLKFNRPEVLQELEAVFVTVEPFGGRKQPSGQKLLFAYLRGQPNH